MVKRDTVFNSYQPTPWPLKFFLLVNEELVIIQATFLHF